MDFTPHLLVCIANEGAEDLQVLKVYRRIPDDSAASRGFVRVVDDSGEDYLYPQTAFLPLPLTPSLEEQLEAVVTERSRA